MGIFADVAGSDFLKGIEYVFAAIYAVIGLLVLIPVVVAVILDHRRHRPLCRSCRKLLGSMDRYCSQCGAAAH